MSGIRYRPRVAEARRSVDKCDVYFSNDPYRMATHAFLTRHGLCWAGSTQVAILPVLDHAGATHASCRAHYSTFTRNAKRAILACCGQYTPCSRSVSHMAMTFSGDACVDANCLEGMAERMECETVVSSCRDTEFLEKLQEILV